MSNSTEPQANKRKVLVTGGAGRIGARLTADLLNKTDWEIYVLDGLVESDQQRLIDNGSLQNERLTFFLHDMRSPIPDALAGVIGVVDTVINLASETDVGRSLDEPIPFVLNNIDLMLCVLEYARVVKPRLLIHIDDEPEWRNPYAASKNCQKSLAVAWLHSYNVPVKILDASGNFAERLIHIIDRSET